MKASVLVLVVLIVGACGGGARLSFAPGAVQAKFDHLREQCSAGAGPYHGWCDGDGACDLPAMLDRATDPPRIAISCVLPD